MDQETRREVRFIEKAKRLLRQFVSFSAIGVLNTVLFYGLYLLFLTVIKPTAAYFLAYALSMAFAILVNLKYTFKKRATIRKLAMFISVYLLSMYVGGLILVKLIDFSVSPQIAGLLIVGVTVIMNFLGLKAAAKWS